MARKPKALPLGPDGFPLPLKWRPVVQVKGLLFGALLTVGGNVLLQQLAYTTLSLTSLIVSLVLGLFIGIAAPSLGRLVGVWMGNRMLRRARKGDRP
ncbi:MAG: hypothetical protein V4510_01320 [bacterium]